jgi:hypothetical protein
MYLLILESSNTKSDIETMGTFHQINLGNYRVLQKNGTRNAIPTMCLLAIKKDKQLMPLQTELRIVVAEPMN